MLTHPIVEFRIEPGCARSVSMVEIKCSHRVNQHICLHINLEMIEAKKGCLNL